ncbi:hypothetical protein KFL_012040010 [Klebsormidium nitens]|uniref:Uncharacterized protein n=1 Tax=Klebsormidium nitens TaxID=105231 RepID=A0A1Y1IUA4_KLENI|nr:hypothetical protein KFL_012040010 [Klebsormidium nitens]|eukprot:GAQ92921.1 hypothetical protein KFL_012040010 [Klebsormidium nitens]
MLPEAAIERGRAARDAPQAKAVKYGDHPADDTFIPLAVETYGCLDSSFDEFLGTCARRAVELRMGGLESAPMASRLLATSVSEFRLASSVARPGQFTIERPARLRGQIASANSSEVASVMLHVFVKCMLTGGGLAATSIICHGWVYAETTGPFEILNTHLMQPPLARTWEPHIEIRCRHRTSPETVYMPYKVQYGPDRERLPFYFWLELPLEVTEQVPEIHIDDWPRFHVFRSVLTRPLLLRQFEERTTATWLVWKGFLFFPPQGDFLLSAKLVVQSIRHHLRMGVLGGSIYVQHHYACELLKDRDITELVLQGKLRIIVWDALARYSPQPRLRYYEQVFLYNHALLDRHIMAVVYKSLTL